MPTAGGSSIGNAYIALNAGKTKLAYDLIKDTARLSVNPAKEQAFMAGWIALRLLKDPKAAEAHFDAMRKAADGPLRRAKALARLADGAEFRGRRRGQEASTRRPPWATPSMACSRA